MRLSRVSGRFAPVIHSTYSRLQLGLKAAKPVAAFLFFCSAVENSAGISTGGFFGFTTWRRAAMGHLWLPWFETVVYSELRRLGI
jgi:hypothetical protein